MKKIVFLLLLVIATVAQAVPAFPGLISFRQPADGGTVMIYLKGDERVHWAETEDGYSLLHRDDGSLVFATKDANGDMIPSPFLATNKDERSPETEAFLSTVPKHLRFSNSQVESLTSIWKQIENAKKGPKSMSEVSGEKKLLLILFEFSDKQFIHTSDNFDAMMNQVNYTVNGRTGSVHDYYYDVSGGLFSLNMDVVGPFRGSRNTAFYGNTDYGYQYFAREAVDSAAKYVNFSDYDNDNDGYIDGLHIIFAGFGEEAGASADCIWSHKSYIYDAPTYNNTVVDLYSCSPECSGNNGSNLTQIGVICHELGHVFGAPDYYDTDYSGSGGEFPGLGQWDIMSSGSWNESGCTPAHHNAYTKLYIYRWATCDTITADAAQYVLDPVAVSSHDFYRVNTSTEGDFFLLENRQKIKWDGGIPGHGLIVYHVHPNANDRNVSNARHPQQIYILARSSNQFPTSSPSSYGSLNSEGASFPGGTLRRDSLTDNSTPWFRPWSKQANNIPIYNISEDTHTGKVFFSVQDVSPDPLSALAEGLDHDKILLSWTRYGDQKTLILMNESHTPTAAPCDTTQLGDTLDDGSVVVYFANSYNSVINNLQQGVVYHFKFFTQRNNSVFSNGITAEGTTLNCQVSDWHNEDFESTPQDQLPECWNGEWKTELLDGNHVLASKSNITPTNRFWQTVTSRPLLCEDPLSHVIKYSAHFFNGCGPQTQLKVEFQSSPSDDWAIIDTITWNDNLEEWNDRFLILNGSELYSRLRFSLYTNSTEKVAIDDLQITDGWLVNSTADNNGNIEPLGYSVGERNDSIEFIITPKPGYEVHRLVYDNRVVLVRRLTPLGDGRYSYKVAEREGLHTMHAAFKRSTAIEQATESAVSVHPNPTSSLLNVTCPSGSIIRLFDTRGSLIMSQTTTDENTTLDLQSLPKGIYILQCNQQTIKVVKR